VDVWVARALGISRAQVKEISDGPGIRVNGRRVKRGDKLEAGAQVTVAWEEASRDVVPQAGLVPLTILYEDAQLVAVDKPARMPSHPLKPGETGTVANALVAQFPECAQASEDTREGGLCHRLDVETSGVILAARTRETWTAMREAFTERKVDKFYWALVTGPLADDGEIDLPLRNSPRHPDRVDAVPEGGPGCREALSRFRVMARQGEWSFVEVQILTGVLHQVRAHLAAIGAPLVGDTRYGGREEPGLDRFFLHARSLAFEQPVTRVRVNVVSPLAEELAALLRAKGFEV
jgi:23S rRNA pseudouridine1911/1915/1917 synthase